MSKKDLPEMAAAAAFARRMDELSEDEQELMADILAMAVGRDGDPGDRAARKRLADALRAGTLPPEEPTDEAEPTVSVDLRESQTTPPRKR